MGKPEIRFKGYTDEWEQRKLGDISEIKTGPFGSTLHADDYVSDGIPIITTEHFKTGTLPIKKDGLPQVSENDFNRLSAYILNEGDIVFSRVGSVDINALITPFQNNWLFSGRVLRVRPQGENSSQFLHTLLETESVRSDIRTRAVGQTMPSINTEILKITPLFLPTSIAEQERLGEYFHNLDHLITLHQRKCDEVKTLKKYMLQKMFPQNEQKIPEIRFEGFTEAWEQRKLSDIYDSIGNAFVGTATPYYAEQGHFYLESNNVKDGQINHNSEIFINDEFYEKQKDKWLHTGDMVMVQSGHVGHAAVIPEELDNTAAHALIMFRNPKEEIEPYFLNYEYQTDKAKKKIENITTGNTIKHILASNMQEFVVDVPNYEEQKVIAGYFRNIDHLITLHQQKCEELKKIKKFMLQKMFV